MKKEKTFVEKIKALKGKAGTIKLSNLDISAFIEANEKYIEKESERFNNYLWLLAGLGLGILGNFITALFYDWVKSLKGLQFISISILLILLVLMTLYILMDKFKEHGKRLEWGYESRNLWRKQKSLKIGPTVKRR